MERHAFSKEQRVLLEKGEIPFAIYQFIDKRVVTLIVSKGFCDLFGYDNYPDAYDEMDNNMYKDTHPEDVVRVAEAALAFANEKSDYDILYRSKNPHGEGYNIIHAIGKHYYTSKGVRVAQVWYTNEGKYVSGSFNEKALNKVYSGEIEEDYLKTNNFDYLTGLPIMNRFFELAEAGRLAMLAKGKRPIMLFFDFSGMKFYNSKYGIGEGDRLIKNFSNVLIKHFSVENCSRFGQDHFAVYTADDNISEVLKEIFEEAQGLNGGRSLPLRVGIYEDRIEYVEASQATDRAKLACNALRDTYVSNYIYFDEEMKRKVNDRQHIIDNIDKAIEEKWIKVYYQPSVRTINGLVCDEEALARWIDPEKGLIMPNDFIPILEQIKQAYKLDLYVLEEVLIKLKIQKEAGLEIVPQSINLSRTDFESCDIVDEIKKRVDKAGIERKNINIEITESVIGEDSDFMREQVEKFKNLGFSVWMDDFGSGYSSLDFFSSIRFDLIKFDRKFMKHLFDKPDNQIVLAELVKLATSLGIDTVCEGIETAEQVKFLQELGCSKLQGFYYTQPIPLEEVLDRYKKGVQIGFEKKNQSSYYDTIGRINLYDLSLLASDEKNINIYKSLPMAIIEIKGDWASCIRYSNSFKVFLERSFGFDISKARDTLFRMRSYYGGAFVDAIEKCCKDNKRIFMNDNLPNGMNVQYYIKRVAKNIITNTVAIAIAVLSMVDAV